MKTAVVARQLVDVDEIATRLAGAGDLDRARHVYEIGDLDPFFFSRCSYFGHPETQATALLYRGSSPATLLALGRATEDVVELALAVIAQTDEVLYAHLAPGIAARIAEREVVGLERHLKLARTTQDWVVTERAGVVRLGAADARAVESFYAEAYPGSWFIARMLETGVYRAVVEGSAWKSIAGVHVLSLSQRVAALGNVATHPSFRGQGAGRLVCSAVMDALAKTVEVVGLNVAADNVAALRLYEGLGFEVVCGYEEMTLRLR